MHCIDLRFIGDKMAVWAIVHNLTKEPLNKYAYTTADTRKEAWTNFKGKWKAGNPGIPSPRELNDRIELSYWNIVEVPPAPPKVEPTKPKQLDLDI